MIIKQNHSLILVDKPAGWLSVPGRTGDSDPRPVLGLHLQSELKTKVFPVHRLDLEVSGLMVFALTPETHRILCSAFEERLIEKTYSALSDGSPPNWQRVRWECLLLRGKKRAYESPHGKKSITDVHFRGQGKQGQLIWYLSPLTGRSHQLRYEMYRHQYPLLGDQLYGSQQRWQTGGIALRSLMIKFPLTLARQIGVNEEERVSDFPELR